MSSMGKPRRAAIYVRISDDRAKDAAGVGRQESDARALADRLGWEIAEVFIENDTSAFKRRKVTLPSGRTELRVVRPEFRRMLDLAMTGAIDGLIAYDLDRTARDPRDLEDLIDVVEGRTPRLPVESVSGSLRLSNDADVTMARVMVAVANKASRDSSRRIRRKHEELAEQGKYAGGGARRFGYERDGMTVNEREAEVIRWCAARVLEGRSVASLCKELDRQGVRPVKAAHWSSRTLTDILRSGRVAGLRVHRGEVVGDAAWPAIVDRETWEAVVATLHGRSGGLAKPGLRYWLNGLLWCGHCGATLQAGYMTNRGHRYWCSTQRGHGCGRIAIAGPACEAEIERQVLEYLARPDVLATLARVTSQTGTEQLRADVADDERQLKELAAMWAEKRIDLAEYAEARRIIAQRLEDARKALSSYVPSHVRSVFEAKDPAKAWSNLDPVGRRDVTRTLVASGGYKGWTVAPADLGKPRRFDADRLALAHVD